MCFRSKLLSMAMMFMDAVQNSASDVSGPIREALHTVIHDGTAAAEAASHPQVKLGHSKLICIASCTL